MMASCGNTEAQNEYWYQRVSLFDTLPVDSTDIVFLGNSITDGGEFAELFNRGDIKNRGISADIISGVSKRLDQITSGKPKKIFLLIGINDISHGHSADKLADDYLKLIKDIRQKSPSTTLYVQSVMPVNNSFGRYKNLIGKEKIINRLNVLIERAAQDNGAVYIDLWPALADDDGNLNKVFTNDGLHLTGAGYKAWADFIREYLDD